MDRYRIMFRGKCESTDPDNPWELETNGEVWAGEDLPTQEDQEQAIVAGIRINRPIPYDVLPYANIQSYELVMQERYVKRVRRFGYYARLLAWRDYESQKSKIKETLTFTPDGWLEPKPSRSARILEEGLN